MASSSQLNLGDDPSDANPGQGNWDGKLDDLAIWSRALGSQELASIYQAGLAGQSLLTLMRPTISCSGPQIVECGTPATVTAQAGEPDGAAFTLVWSLNGKFVQTNMIPAGSPPTATNLSFTAELPLGTNLVEVTAANSLSNAATCSTTVAVVDTTPPVIASASVSPNVLWPPNHKMITATVNASATDNCDGAPTWKIISVQSSEPVNGKGDGNTTPDWQILSDHTVALRAERSGASARTYAITIQAEDASGNLSFPRTVQVMVPQSQNMANG
ncbi:MAG TPA: hypothetical protein VKA67_01120 [Verrucomicrobiae bacterium]|nr:hypothetical protein [Verrucomicrobiae bacterium]